MISFKNGYYSVPKEIKRKWQETDIAHCEFEPDKMKEGLGFVFYVFLHVQRENLYVRGVNMHTLYGVYNTIVVSCLILLESSFQVSTLKVD